MPSADRSPEFRHVLRALAVILASISGAAALEEASSCAAPVRPGSGSALMQQRPQVALVQDRQEPSVADTAPQDEEGYQLVAGTCCNYDMEVYIRKVIDSMGYEICQEGGLSGFVPFFTCEKGVRSFSALKDHLLSSSLDTQCPFLALRGECPPYPACDVRPDTYHRRRSCAAAGTTPPPYPASTKPAPVTTLAPAATAYPATTPAPTAKPSTQAPTTTLAPASTTAAATSRKPAPTTTAAQATTGGPTTTAAKDVEPPVTTAPILEATEAPTTSAPTTTAAPTTTPASPTTAAPTTTPSPGTMAAPVTTTPRATTTLDCSTPSNDFVKGQVCIAGSGWTPDSHKTILVACDCEKCKNHLHAGWKYQYANGMPACDTSACTDFVRDTETDLLMGQPGGDGSEYPPGEVGTCETPIFNMYSLCHMPFPEGCTEDFPNVTCGGGRTAFTCPMCGDSKEECDGGDCMWLHDSKGQASLGTFEYTGACVPNSAHWGETMVKCSDGSRSKRCRACREDVCGGDDCQWAKVVQSSATYSECAEKRIANLCPDGNYSRSNCKGCGDGVFVEENNVCTPK